jgi:molecular chaperone GrpE
MQERAEREETAPEPAAPSDRDARVAELEARCSELEARWLRAQADYQNARRRAQQELDSALLRSLQPLLEQLLLTLDSLDMALALGAEGAEARALHGGVNLTRKELAQALELADVRPIPTSGAFDPLQHEAAGARPSSEHAPGTILATLRPGYTWQGRILRPARVLVAAASAPES